MAAFRARGNGRPLPLPPRPNVCGPGLTIPESRDPPKQPKTLLRSAAAVTSTSSGDAIFLKQIAQSSTSEKIPNPEVGLKRSALRFMAANRAEEAVEALMTREKLVIQRQPVREKRAVATGRKKEQEKIEDAARDERARLREVIL